MAGLAFEVHGKQQHDRHPVGGNLYGVCQDSLLATSKITVPQSADLGSS